MPWTPEQMFQVVADFDRYPEFLPWCVASRITKREGNVVWGDLAVGFKVFRETFASRVTLDPPGRVDVEYIDGPFRFLKNHWLFIPEKGGTTVDFYIDFEFRSRFLATAFGPVFEEAVRRMVEAFEKRAGKLYGGGAKV